MAIALVGLGRVTRHLPPAAYGQFALALTATTLLSLWLGSIAAATSRFTASSIERGQTGALVAALTRTLAARLGVLIALGAAGALLAFVVHSTQLSGLILATAGYAAATGVSLNAEAILNARRLRPQLAVHKACQQALNYACALALLRIAPCAALAMAGFFVGTTVIAVSEALVARRALPASNGSPPDAAEVAALATQLRDYGRPYERWGIPAWLLNASDRWALAVFASTGDAGLYAVAYQLGYSPVALSAGLLAQVVEPIAYARAGDGSHPERVRSADRVRHWTMTFFVAACVAVAAAAWVLRGPLFDVLVDPAYRPAADWLPWLVLAAMLSCLGNLESIRWLIRAEPQRLQPARIWMSFGGCALIAAGAALDGARGVIAGQAVASILFLVWVRRLRPPGQPVGGSAPHTLE